MHSIFLDLTVLIKILTIRLKSNDDRLSPWRTFLWCNKFNYSPGYMVSFEWLNQKIMVYLSKSVHCMKIVRIQSFSGSYFPALGSKKLPIQTLFTQWFFKSKRVTAQLLCFNFALFMIYDKHSICSIQPDIFSQKPFWRFVSMYLLFEAKLKSLFQIMEVNTFESTGCKVIERKFYGFSVSPVLKVNTVTPDFHTSRNVFSVKAVWRIFVRCERRTGHVLKVIALTWSRGQGDADNFVFMMTFVISTEVGGCMLKSVVEFSNCFIHEECGKRLCWFFSFKVFLK